MAALGNPGSASGPILMLAAKTKTKKKNFVQQKVKVFRASDPVLSVFMWGVNHSVGPSAFAFELPEAPPFHLASTANINSLPMAISFPTRIPAYPAFCATIGSLFNHALQSKCAFVIPDQSFLRRRDFVKYGCGEDNRNIFSTRRMRKQNLHVVFIKLHVSKIDHASY